MAPTHTTRSNRGAAINKTIPYPRRAICAMIKTGIEICILFRFWSGLNRGFYSLIRERSSHYRCKDALDQWGMHYFD